ncbi:MAG: hypothetical protein HY782_11615 [Chloroflexi bacterium]|nr:hypothetical protein [Chloroflexota bacterium]
MTFLLSGCSPAPTPTALPTITPTLLPTATVTKSATPTPLPTTTPTLPPTATATKAPTPTVPPTPSPTKPPAATVAAAVKAAGVAKDICLSCHGPFDKLVSASINYLWPNEKKATPHRYVPHISRDIPECSNCHPPHPLPPSASDITAAVKAANPQWCFTCHHTGALECGTCHEIPEATATPKP